MNRKKGFLRKVWGISLAALGALLVAGCGGLPKDYATVSTAMPVDQESSAYTISKGDTIEIKFPYTENFNEEVVVRTDGHITTRVAGEFEAAGLTTQQFSEVIRQKASSRLKDPMVVVNVKHSSLRVYVGGEVTTPGFVNYRDGITALQAVFERGGFRDTAQWDKVVVLRTEGKTTKRVELNIDSISSAPLAPSDVVYVQKTGMAKAGLAVKQFRDLLPIPAGMTASTPIP